MSEDTFTDEKMQAIEARLSSDYRISPESGWLLIDEIKRLRHRIRCCYNDKLCDPCRYYNTDDCPEWRNGRRIT